MAAKSLAARGLRLSSVFQVGLGLLASNMSNLATVVVTAAIVPQIQRYPAIPALIPVAAALRGAILASMASRLSTALHLGEVPPKSIVMASYESRHVISLTLVSSLAGSIVVYSMTGLDAEVIVLSSIIAGLAALLVLIPAATGLTAVVYRRGLDPDNVIPPMITSLGDLTTIPVLAYIVVLSISINSINPTALEVLALALAFCSLAFTMAVFMGGGRSRRILVEQQPVLAFIVVAEGLTGLLYASYREELSYLALIHVVPSFLQNAGAASSIAGSRISTHLNLYGLAKIRHLSASVIVDVSLGSLLPMVLLGLIAYLAAPLGGLEPSLLYLVLVILVSFYILLVAGYAIGVLLGVVAEKLNADPDNVMVPVLTALIDLVGILVLIHVGRLFSVIIPVQLAP